MDFKQWFHETSGSKITDQYVANTLNVSRKTANKRLNDGLSADDIIKLCQALEVSCTVALVELGYLDHKDVMAYMEADGTLLETATDAELALELARRIAPHSAGW